MVIGFISPAGLINDLFYFWFNCKELILGFHINKRNYQKILKSIDQF